MLNLGEKAVYYAARH